MEEETSRARKRRVRLIAGLFIGLLIVFTLAGNTIKALTLPKVVTTIVNKGSLNHTFKGSATVNAKESIELTNPAGWKVAKVLVKEGDAVHKGQTLVQYDDSAAKQDITDSELNLTKHNMSMEQMKYAFIAAAQQDDPIAKLNATTALETAKLDSVNMQQHLAILKKNLSINQKLVAPFDGIVTAVGAIEGLSVGNGPDIKISNSTKGYGIELLVPSDIASMLSVGETLDSITLIGAGNEAVPGKIESIEAVKDALESSSMNSDDKAPAPTYRMVISLGGTELQGGERVQVAISKVQADDQILVPLTAVHKEMNGAFVYVVNEKQSPLGNSSYVTRVPIKISDSNDSTVAVSEGLYGGAEVIVDHDGLITDGASVHK